MGRRVSFAPEFGIGGLVDFEDAPAAVDEIMGLGVAHVSIRKVRREFERFKLFFSQDLLIIIAEIGRRAHDPRDRLRNKAVELPLFGGELRLLRPAPRLAAAPAVLPAELDGEGISQVRFFPDALADEPQSVFIAGDKGPDGLEHRLLSLQAGAEQGLPSFEGGGDRVAVGSSQGGEGQVGFLDELGPAGPEDFVDQQAGVLAVRPAEHGRERGAEIGHAMQASGIDVGEEIDLAMAWGNGQASEGHGGNAHGVVVALHLIAEAVIGDDAHMELIPASFGGVKVVLISVVQKVTVGPLPKLAGQVLKDRRPIGREGMGGFAGSEIIGKQGLADSDAVHGESAPDPADFFWMPR